MRICLMRCMLPLPPLTPQIMQSKPSNGDQCVNNHLHRMLRNAGFHPTPLIYCQLVLLIFQVQPTWTLGNAEVHHMMAITAPAAAEALSEPSNGDQCVNNHQHRTDAPRATARQGCMRASMHASINSSMSPLASTMTLYIQRHAETLEAMLRPSLLATTAITMPRPHNSPLPLNARCLP